MAFTDWIAETFYGAGELQAESDRLDAQRQALNESRSYRYGDEWYQDTLANDRLSRIDAAAEIGAEFEPRALRRNLSESVETGSDWVRTFIGAPLSFAFRSIPPLGWLVIAGVIFWWVGGPVWLRGILQRRGYGVL